MAVQYCRQVKGLRGVMSDQLLDSLLLLSPPALGPSSAAAGRRSISNSKVAFPTSRRTFSANANNNHSNNQVRYGGNDRIPLSFKYTKIERLLMLMMYHRFCLESQLWAHV
jgi:hypothetical protein